MNTSVFDTETCGTENGCIILTLSAVKFDRKAGYKLLDPEFRKQNSFNRVLSIPEQILAGRTVEQSCIQEFWKKQPKNAIEAAFFADSSPVKDSLNDFFKFVEGTQVFCRGTDFDPPKLSSLCRDFKVKMPIKYNAFRDVRTYIDALMGTDTGYLIDWETPDWITPHISLDDCWRDALQMIAAFHHAHVPPRLNAE